MEPFEILVAFFALVTVIAVAIAVHSVLTDSSYNETKQRIAEEETKRHSKEQEEETKRILHGDCD